MSFLTERALGDHMLAPRGDTSTIRQVHHPRFSPDFLRLAQFFCTTGVYAAAEFRFTGHRQAIVLVEASAIRRLSAPGVSHVFTVVIFSGDIRVISHPRHTTIRTSLREWGQQLATEWNQWLTCSSDNLVPTDDIEVRGLRTGRPASRSREDSSSQREYLDPRRIIDLAFFQPRTASKDEGLTLEEEEEEGIKEGDEEKEEETSEEAGSYSEYSEEESGKEEEEEEEEEDQLEEKEGSEWEALGEEAEHAETRDEDPEVVRRREEIAAGKQPLEFASEVDLPIPKDPAKDPKPPKNDNRNLVAETSSAPARRRRS
ncbi:hypothetical protein CBR_g8462 [Chara braunii]|uniref:Uncharacterized protein n=1 Tax=Chara braunii TaxID=69332 RepID=A0A388KM83_CHABU|nr:hypothetical protein CBR_g8462 [Chara braunii]|eukprot:GBG71160.1 hypothetical protein CBR_g8462 [Chara braunii]